MDETREALINRLLARLKKALEAQTPDRQEAFERDILGPKEGERLAKLKGRRGTEPRDGSATVKRIPHEPQGGGALG